MSANMFGYTSGYISPHVWALNKAQMYAGALSGSVVDFAGPSTDFTILPANARLQTGTPTAGTPEYFVGTSTYLNAQTVYKFHVDWNTILNSTFTGPFTPMSATSWPNASVPNAATPANANETLPIRAMAQAQYSNIGGAESLWVSHTVRRANTTGFAAPRWYQINVTGGTVAPNDVQAATWDPDGANTSYRYVPSLAVDRMGNLAIGYSKSNSTTNPQIKYAGRLATDPLDTFSQGEQTLIDGTGSQLGNCGSTCTRWGDYSAMTLDPDGCTFWYTSEYYVTNGLNHQTRIGSFRFPGCTVSSSTTTLVVDTATGTHGGTVNLSATLTSNSNPVSGKSVSFSLNGVGVGSASTNGSGVATLSNVSLTGIAVGTYPTGVSASWAGDSSYDPSSGTASLEVDEGAASTTTSLTSSSNPSVFSQSVSFTATVTSAAGTPTTGSVQFKINGVNFGSPVALDGTGKAVSGTTTTLAVGNRPISAVYSGTSGFGPSTGNLTQTVNKAAATVAVTSNHNPAKKGTKIIFTVTVTPTAPAAATPTGKVKLFRNGVGLGTKHNLVSGQAAITVTWTAAKGTFNITAKYFGSANFLVAVSPAYQQVIN
jgi:Bacterial Ig-like domain (group 3)